MHQQIMLAVGGASGGGAGLPPNTYAGLTFWYDGDNSAHYIGPDSLSGTPVDGGNCQRADSVASISRVLSVTGGAYTREIPLVGSANGIVSDSGVTARLWARPAAGASPSVGATVANLFSAANSVIIMACRVDSADPDSGVPYTNNPLVGDVGQFMGLYCYQSGGAITFQGYNWDGTDDAVSTTEASGTWAIITVKHSGGQLRIRKNGGPWTQTASGNTTTLTGQVMGPEFFGGGVAQFCTYNANRADAEVLEVERYFGAKVGLSF